MSLFNKMDGYDTFAHSEGMSRELIENELTAVTGNKLTPQDIELTQRGAMPVVFCRFNTSEGLAHSAITCMENDYTGERSSYMVHTLLLSDEEKAAYGENPDTALLNPDVFLRDLSGFDLTSFEASPITDFAEKDLPACKSGEAATLVEAYDTGMLKRLIYALLGIACGKTKGLFLCFHTPVASFSETALSFLNKAVSVFPYHLRPFFSFVTFSSTPAKYNAFKIKCLPEVAETAPAAKGVTLKMNAKEYVGISDDNIAANRRVVDFLFELFTNDALRREFLEFCRYAVEQNEALRKPSMKNVDDLVLLFRVLCGHYPEAAVLPNDDAVYEYICVYDKNRGSLTEEYRARSMKCLTRYAEHRVAIPKNVFSKVCSVYASEPAASKHTAMNVALDLIHTDAMREKLFSFIKANYEKEDEYTRANIMENVCRVYYGGFLQKPLIEFFADRFETEPEKTRMNIVERLLLTLRTPAVQEQILAFLDRFYPTFTEDEKDKFYRIFFDMLPEADTLSRRLCTVVDTYIEDSRKDEVAEKLLALVEADEKKREPALCGCIASECGFCESVLAAKVFTDWSNRKIVDAFVAALCQKELPARISTIVEIWNAAPAMTEATANRLFDSLAQQFGAATKCGLFALIAAADQVATLQKDVPPSAAFAARLCEELLCPAVVECVPTAFDVKRYPNGVEDLATLAANRPYIANCAEYACVRDYLAAIDSAKAQQPAKVLSSLDAIPGKPVRAGAAQHLKQDTAALELDDTTHLAVLFGAAALTAEEPSLSDAAATLREKWTNAAYAAEGGADAATVLATVDERLLDTVLALGGAIAAADTSDTLKAAVAGENGEVCKYVAQYIQKYEKKGKKTLLAKLDTLNAPAPYVETLRTAANGGKAPSSGGLFKRLFH